MQPAMRALAFILLAACDNAGTTHRPDAQQQGGSLPHGLVELTTGTSNGAASSGADAQMSPSGILGTANGSVGPCTAFSTSTAPTRQSAGTITIHVGTTTYTLQASGTAPSVSYAVTPTVAIPAFQPGETITFSAAGGPDVGAFSGSVVAPATLAGFTPPTTMSRSGYTATWSAGNGSIMWVILIGSDPSNQTEGMLCQVPDTGSFTVTSAMFGLWSSSDNMAQAALGRLATATVTASGNTILLAATSYVTPGGFVPLDP